MIRLLLSRILNSFSKGRTLQTSHLERKDLLGITVHQSLREVNHQAILKELIVNLMQ